MGPWLFGLFSRVIPPLAMWWLRMHTVLLLLPQYCCYLLCLLETVFVVLFEEAQHAPWIASIHLRTVQTHLLLNKLIRHEEN